MATKKAETLLASTTEALSGGVDSAKPKSGATLIHDWIAVVKKEDSLGTVADELQQLHDELGKKEPDAKKVAQLMTKLGHETTKAAKSAGDEYKASLKDLADSLGTFANELK